VEAFSPAGSAELSVSVREILGLSAAFPKDLNMSELSRLKFVRFDDFGAF